VELYPAVWEQYPPRRVDLRSGFIAFEAKQIQMKTNGRRFRKEVLGIQEIVKAPATPI
jgi:hypothetical protein